MQSLLLFIVPNKPYLVMVETIEWNGCTVPDLPSRVPSEASNLAPKKLKAGTKRKATDEDNGKQTNATSATASKKSKQNDKQQQQQQLEKRIKKAKESAGPINFNPPNPNKEEAIKEMMLMAKGNNDDIDRLNMTQIEQEIAKADQRLTLLRARYAYLKSSGKKVRKLCTHIDIELGRCTNLAQKGGVCKSHGAPYNKKLCEVEGCTRKAQRARRCYTHGATYKQCSVEDCTKKAQQGGVCIRHGMFIFYCLHAYLSIFVLSY